MVLRFTDVEKHVLFRDGSLKKVSFFAVKVLERP